MDDIETRAKAVLAFHERTKHHLHRYARSLGYMDWDNQPDPFRTYEGTTRVPLPLTREGDARGYSVLYTGQSDGAQPTTLHSIGRLLELSLGLSAWKKFGPSRWSLRMNPSSGNLHPTESYLILPDTGEAPACLAHYNPFFHALEVRSRLGEHQVNRLTAARGFGVILSSIHWREAWKYGERAFRYCHHDVGHALAALRFSAALLGWHPAVQRHVSPSDLDRILGFDRIEWPQSEAEHADCLLWVAATTPSLETVDALLASFDTLSLEGRPNRLSQNHVAWEVIDSVFEASLSPGEPSQSWSSERPAPQHFTDSSLSASSIIRRRRSAQAYDFGRSRTDRDTFLSMMERTLPFGYSPFDGFTFDPQVHLALFVHNVDGLDPGLYFLLRNVLHQDEIRLHLSSRFHWGQPEDGFPLYLLERGDFRQTAMTVSCHQEIAGASAFSLGMLARFRPNVAKCPWSYPRLFWETGVIGQVLYLEAEAHELRGTGIGCFFDDEMHRVLGLEDDTYQSLYHFTVGVALEDPRLQTLEPYHHLEEGRFTSGKRL